MATLKYALLALLIAGCASTLNSAPPPEDWPELDIKVIAVPAAEMRAACTFDGVSLSEIACALINFDKMLCTIIYPDDKPMTPEVRRHEGADGKEGHCQGKDHPGEDTLRRAWEKWKTR